MLDAVGQVTGTVSTPGHKKYMYASSITESHCWGTEPMLSVLRPVKQTSEVVLVLHVVIA